MGKEERLRPLGSSVMTRILERVGDEERRVSRAVSFKFKARIWGSSARGYVGVEGAGGFAVGGEGKEIEREDDIFVREKQR
jgi:hypothetical protein